jgi:predicted kinase
MQKIILTVGIPASSKTTWSKEEVKKNPEGITRINRDDLRSMMSNYHFSDSNEKLVTAAKTFMIQQALRYGRDIIIDETNLNRRNFDDICKLVREMNVECMVMEKPFFVELDEAIARDAARPGHGKVGEEVVRKFWKKAGGTQHKHYKPRVEIIQRQTEQSVAANKPKMNPSLPQAIVCDLDGTLSLFNSIRSDGSVDVRYAEAHTRSPYDAAKCHNDMLNDSVAAVIEAMHKADYKIIFCSGREDLYREQTVAFIEKHLGVPYELHMRKTGDLRKDSIVKEEIYHGNIAPNYNVFLVLDDRTSVVAFWRSKGLPCWQVAPGDF